MRSTLPKNGSALLLLLLISAVTVNLSSAQNIFGVNQAQCFRFMKLADKNDPSDALSEEEYLSVVNGYKREMYPETKPYRDLSAAFKQLFEDSLGQGGEIVITGVRPGQDMTNAHALYLEKVCRDTVSLLVSEMGPTADDSAAGFDLNGLLQEEAEGGPGANSTEGGPEVPAGGPEGPGLGVEGGPADMDIDSGNEGGPGGLPFPLDGNITDPQGEPGVPGGVSYASDGNMTNPLGEPVDFVDPAVEPPFPMDGNITEPQGEPGGFGDPEIMEGDTTAPLPSDEGGEIPMPLGNETGGPPPIPETVSNETDTGSEDETDGPTPVPVTVSNMTGGNETDAESEDETDGPTPIPATASNMTGGNETDAESEDETEITFSEDDIPQDNETSVEPTNMTSEDEIEMGLDDDEMDDFMPQGNGTSNGTVGIPPIPFFPNMTDGNGTDIGSPPTEGNVTPPSGPTSRVTVTSGFIVKTDQPITDLSDASVETFTQAFAGLLSAVAANVNTRRRMLRGRRLATVDSNSVEIYSVEDVPCPEPATQRLLQTNETTSDNPPLFPQNSTDEDAIYNATGSDSELAIDEDGPNDANITGPPPDIGIPTLFTDSNGTTPGNASTEVPLTLPANGTCQKLSAKYDIILEPGEDPEVVKEQYSAATREAIDDGVLEQNILEIDPESPFTVEGSTEPPPAPTEPPTEPPAPSNITEAPLSNATASPTIEEIEVEPKDEGGSMLPMIIGIVVGVVVLCGCGAAAFLFLQKKKSVSDDPDEDAEGEKAVDEEDPEKAVGGDDAVNETMDQAMTDDDGTGTGEGEDPAAPEMVDGDAAGSEAFEDEHGDDPEAVVEEEDVVVENEDGDEEGGESENDEDDVVARGAEEMEEVQLEEDEAADPEDEDSDEAEATPANEDNEDGEAFDDEPEHEDPPADEQGEDPPEDEQGEEPDAAAVAEAGDEDADADAESNGGEDAEDESDHDANEEEEQAEEEPEEQEAAAEEEAHDENDDAEAAPAATEEEVAGNEEEADAMDEGAGAQEDENFETAEPEGADDLEAGDAEAEGWDENVAVDAAEWEDGGDAGELPGEETKESGEPTADPEGDEEDWNDEGDDSHSTY